MIPIGVTHRHKDGVLKEGISEGVGFELGFKNQFKIGVKEIEDGQDYVSWRQRRETGPQSHCCSPRIQHTVRRSGPSCITAIGDPPDHSRATLGTPPPETHSHLGHQG